MFDENLLGLSLVEVIRYAKKAGGTKARIATRDKNKSGDKL
jgi:hypothetical protein